VNHRQQTIDNLRTLARSPYASDALRDAIATAINRAATALDLAAANTERLREIESLHQHLNDNGPREIAAAILAGRTPRTDAILGRVAKCHQARQEALRADRMTNAAAGIVAADLGRVYADHDHDLARLVAQYRAAAGTKCGDDAIPAWVRDHYRAHPWRWWPAWDPALDVDRWRYNDTQVVHRLPIVYAIEWPDIVRASLVWIWGEVANGRYEFAKHPKRGRCLRLTAWVECLPVVPPTPRTRNQHQPVRTVS
jgi:hypothetical protein